MSRSLAAVVVVACLVGGVASGQAATATPVRCPAHAPELGGARTPRVGSRFADPGATVLLLCRYAGLNARPALALAQARRIGRLATIKELTHELDTLPVRRRGIYDCPMDDGSRILLVFGYRNRDPETVLVGLKGCMPITNGRIGTLALPSRDGVRFVHRLTALTS